MSKVHPYEIDVKIKASRKISILARLPSAREKPVAKTELDALLNDNPRNQMVRRVRKKMMDALSECEDGTEDSPLASISREVDAWTNDRFVSLVSLLRLESEPKAELIYNARMLSVCIASKEAAANNSLDYDLEAQIWEEYAVKVKNKPQSMPRIITDEVEEELEQMKDMAFDHFNDQLENAMSGATVDELALLLYHLPTIGNGTMIFSKLFPHLTEKTPKELLRAKIIPKILMLCTINRSEEAAKLLLAIIEEVKSMNVITQATANSMLEYAPHVVNSEAHAAVVALNSLRHLISSEAIALSTLLCAAKSHDHALSMLELYIIEQTGFDHESELKFEKELGEDYSFTTLIGPLIYVFLGVAALSSHTRNMVMAELIQMYEDPFTGILESFVTKEMHDEMLKQLFGLACGTNHWTVVMSLIEFDWAPDDILPYVKDSTRLGYQKVLHLLLESLIAPDHSIKTVSGMVPKIFIKSDVLRALPMVAKRFPTEVSWFLGELSYIPIPLAVPKTLDHEPLVRSGLVKGLRLGIASLATLLNPDNMNSAPEDIWKLVNKEGQLRNASKRRSEPDYETDCVICMAPESLVTEEAFHESVGSKYTKQTNSLIRLLATGISINLGNDTIILKPVTQALMEFHWLYGKFWMRFLAQFSFVLCAITTCAILFYCLVVRVENPGLADYIPIVSSVTIVLSSLFLVQELRQFADDPKDYIHSTTNVIDLAIHSCVTYIAIGAGYFDETIPPILMSLILVLHANRLLLHLRILPSVGPIVRITILAAINIFPILIPMGIMLIAFAGGFFLIQTAQVPNTNWKTFPLAMEYVTTMITFDYTVIDNSVMVENFILRIMFHTYFLIFFVNIIIALMTVNVADITSNSKEAWLIEVSELMVELEIYWPYPFTYLPLSSPLDFSNMHFLWKMFLKRSFEDLLSSQKLMPNSKQKKSVLPDLEAISVVLYTAPRDIVEKTSWWTSYPHADGTGGEVIDNIQGVIAEDSKLLSALINKKVLLGHPTQRTGVSRLDSSLSRTGSKAQKRGSFLSQERPSTMSRIMTNLAQSKLGSRSNLFGALRVTGTKTSDVNVKHETSSNVPTSHPIISRRTSLIIHDSTMQKADVPPNDVGFAPKPTVLLTPGPPSDGAPNSQTSMAALRRRSTSLYSHSDAHVQFLRNQTSTKGAEKSSEDSSIDFQSIPSPKEPIIKQRVGDDLASIANAIADLQHQIRTEFAAQRTINARFEESLGLGQKMKHKSIIDSSNFKNLVIEVVDEERQPIIEAIGDNNADSCKDNIATISSGKVVGFFGQKPSQPGNEK